MKTQLPVTVVGHCVITDDLGNVVLNKLNAIHSINMARVISRGLAHEGNCWIDRIAFGNGGTYYQRRKGSDGKYNNYIQYNKPNDGYNDGLGWRSRLYNETYSENVDYDIGYGDGSVPIDYPSNESDTSGCGCVSHDMDRISQVVVTCKLNFYEPLGQFKGDYSNTLVPFDSSFVFDEIGLYTAGAPIEDTRGHQIIYIADITDNIGLIGSYSFDISVDDGDYQTIELFVNNEKYKDIANLINEQLVGAKAIINDGTTVNKLEAYSGIRFVSDTYGDNSSISIKKENNFFTSLAGFVDIGRPVNGQHSGYQNNICDDSTERSRLLTHLIFSPVLKSYNREFNIKYTLTVYVNRTTTRPLIELMNSKLLNNEVNVHYDVRNANLIKADNANTINADISRIVHNLNMRGDVWSISGIALDGVFFENQYNYKHTLPQNCVRSNTKCTAVIEDKLYITLEIPDSISTFNKIDIYMSGTPASNTKGMQYIKIDPVESTDLTGLNKNLDYTFDIIIDDQLNSISINNVDTYDSLITQLNTALNPLGAVAKLGPVITIESNTVGNDSIILISNDDLFKKLSDYIGIFDKIDGVAGVDIHRPGQRDTPYLLYTINANVGAALNKKLQISMATNNDSNY